MPKDRNKILIKEKYLKRKPKLREIYKKLNADFKRFLVAVMRPGKKSDVIKSLGICHEIEVGLHEFGKQLHDELLRFGEMHL